MILNENTIVVLEENGVSSCPTMGLLICILISENQGLEKSRSISNPEKRAGFLL